MTRAYRILPYGDDGTTVYVMFMRVLAVEIRKKAGRTVRTTTNRREKNALFFALRCAPVNTRSPSLPSSTIDHCRIVYRVRKRAACARCVRIGPRVRVAGEREKTEKKYLKNLRIPSEESAAGLPSTVRVERRTSGLFFLFFFVTRYRFVARTPVGHVFVCSPRFSANGRSFITRAYETERRDAIRLENDAFDKSRFSLRTVNECEGCEGCALLLLTARFQTLFTFANVLHV